MKRIKYRIFWIFFLFPSSLPFMATLLEHIYWLRSDFIIICIISHPFLSLVHFFNLSLTLSLTYLLSSVCLRMRCFFPKTLKHLESFIHSWVCILYSKVHLTHLLLIISYHEEHIIFLLFLGVCVDHVHDMMAMAFLFHVR